MTDLSSSEGFFWRKLLMEHHLTYQEQLKLFKKKGITGIDENDEKQVNTIKVIGYYKLKQYAYVFWDKDSKQYKNISFTNLIKRYYRDQSLRHEVFQAIGDIETAFNSEISYILGEVDPYLYLNLKNGVKFVEKTSILKIKKWINIRLKVKN